jgi:uncharacterized protein YlaI
MPDIRFFCPECDGRLAVDESAAGYRVNCPECHQPIRIPTTSDPAMGPAAPTPDPMQTLTPDEVAFLST